MKENQLKGILVELIETKSRKSAFDVFLQSEEIPQESITEQSNIGKARGYIFSVLQNAKQEYSQITNSPEIKEIFQKLADLETTIIQSRSALATQTKLTILNQKRGGSETSYVVARAPFFNPDYVKAEIRVYLGKTEELGNDLTKLSSDSNFMENAEKLIVKAMVEVMEKRGAFASIKKSVAVNKLIIADGEEENSSSNETSSKTRAKLKKPVRENPFSPKHTPRSKGGYKYLGPNPENEKGK